MPGEPVAPLRFTRHAMATVFEVLISGEEEEYAGQAARAVFDEVGRIERLFNRFDPSSEVGRINRLGPDEGLAVGVETYECLGLAEELRRAVGGAFDVNVRALVKYGRGAGPAPLELRRGPGGFAVRRRVLPGGAAVPLDLDLGGIGKGYALDRAIEVLEEWSVGNALIHGGTSTAIARGDAPGPGNAGKGWPVGVGGGWPCPEAPDSFPIRGRALSGSGTEVKGEHVLDPRTGLPAAGHLAAWAAHPSAAVADALSTAFLVMSTAEVEAYALGHPEVWALLVRDYGNCRVISAGTAPESR